VLSGGEEDLMEEDIVPTESELGGIGVIERTVSEVIVLPPVLSLLPGDDTPEN